MMHGHVLQYEAHGYHVMVTISTENMHGLEIGTLYLLPCNIIIQ